MREKITIHQSWKKIVSSFFSSERGKKLQSFIYDEYQNYTVYPAPSLIFHALNLTPLENVSVVILGQDPYHGKNQAIGLSFAVQDDVKFPPSLLNIFKEIKSDTNQEPFNNGNLTRWATQGVLLLNATLTVRSGEAGSHQKKGWEDLTDLLIKEVSDTCDHVVFILWGNYAKQKKNLIDHSKHLVISSPHPSPLSAHSGFFGSKPFTKANTFLRIHKKDEIDWQ